MKKLNGLFGGAVIVYLIAICLVLTSCQKETVSLPTDIATKVFIQVDAINNDGTVVSSQITTVQ